MQSIDQGAVDSAAFQTVKSLLKRLQVAELAKQSDERRAALDGLQSFYSGCDTTTQYKILTDAIELGCQSVRELLRTALSGNTSALVRHEAAFGLGVFRNPADEEILVSAMLKDPHLMVRHEAAIALALVGTAACLPALEVAIKDNEVSVAESAEFARREIELRLADY